jgi:polyhydroxyalkanoate synthesis regulator protein
MEMPMVAAPKYLPILIRRYGRSRLYDTVAGRYVTLDDLRQWLKDGVAFTVQDSESGADVTRVLLA